jgi:hypothetical protein
MPEGTKPATPDGITPVGTKDAMSLGSKEATNALRSDSEGHVTDVRDGPGESPRAHRPLRTTLAAQRSVVWEGQAEVRHLVVRLIRGVCLGEETGGSCT